MGSYAIANYEIGATLVQPAINIGKRGDVNAVAIGSIATVLTPTTGTKYVLLGGYVSVSSAASILFEDNASGTTVFRTPLLPANTPFYFDIGRPYVATAIDNVLKATSSASASITGTLFYAEI